MLWNIDAKRGYKKIDIITGVKWGGGERRELATARETVSEFVSIGKNYIRRIVTGRGGDLSRDKRLREKECLARLI